MAEISPLHGIRFDSGRCGPLGPLIAPPYDVAGARGHRAEFSISAIENVDLGAPGNQHELAAETYARWLAEGVLVRDDQSSYYVHRQTFLVDGQEQTRTGFLARVRLRDWADRVVLPHEATVPGPKLERLARLRSVGANLSPLYFLFRDPEAAVRTLLADSLVGATTEPAIDRVGGVHLLQPIADPALQQQIMAVFADRTLFVADGHHRYEAALMYRDEQRHLHPGQEGPWEYVLALLCAVEDPGVLVRPTHRVVTGGETLSAAAVMDALGPWFDLSPGDSPNGRVGEPLFRLALAGGEPTWEARARPGNPHLGLLSGDRAEAWRHLEVSAAEGAIDRLKRHDLGGAGLSVEPVVGDALALSQVRDGAAQAAFLLPVPRVDHLLAVAEKGDLLPPKSTWFEPKAPAGLVINDHLRSEPD